MSRAWFLDQFHQLQEVLSLICSTSRGTMAPSLLNVETRLPPRQITTSIFGRLGSTQVRRPTMTMITVSSVPVICHHSEMPCRFRNHRIRSRTQRCGPRPSPRRPILSTCWPPDSVPGTLVFHRARSRGFSGQTDRLIVPLKSRWCPEHPRLNCFENTPQQMPPNHSGIFQDFLIPP